LGRPIDDPAALTSRTFDAITWIADTFATSTPLTRRTNGANARVIDAFTVLTDLLAFTGDVITGVADTFTVDTVLTERTTHLGATPDTLAGAAEASSGAINTSAGVVLAHRAGTALSVRAPATRAVVVETGAILAELPFGTFDVGTEILAASILTRLSLWTFHDRAGLDTGPVYTEQTIETLIIDAGTGTGALHTHRPIGTDGHLVDIPVTVIVEAVTGIRGGVATIATGIPHILVDESVAIIVGEITPLDPGIRIRITRDGPIDTARHTRRTGPRLSGSTNGAGALESAFVDGVVAVVVEPIAQFIGRLNQLLTHHTFAGAHFVAGSTHPIQASVTVIAPTDAFVEATITVIVFTVTRLVCGFILLIADQIAGFTP